MTTVFPIAPPLKLEPGVYKMLCPNVDEVFEKRKKACPLYPPDEK